MSFDNVVLLADILGRLSIVGADHQLVTAMQGRG